MRIARHPCLMLFAYTVAAVIGVTVLVATEGPWVRDNGMPAMSAYCMRPGLNARIPDDAVSAHIGAQLAMSYAWSSGNDVRAVSEAIQCFWALSAIAEWYEGGRFNRREAGLISFWIILLLVPAWAFFYRRTRATSGLTVEQVEALAKRLPG